MDLMDLLALTKVWPLMHAVVQELWTITEPHVEESAVRNGVPIELYLYSELGLSNFSLQNFEKRDPFTNPEQFEKVFVRLNVKGWIEPLFDGSYRVTDKARDGVRHIVRMGDTQLLDFKSMPESEMKRLADLLKQLVLASQQAPEPPERWAVITRFRIADDYSPLIVQVREHLLDLFAYRDDAHLMAARPYFNQAGIVWLVLGCLWKGDAVTARQMADKMSFRGYDANDYEIAIQAAVELGWAESVSSADAFRLTAEGTRMREQAEHLTNKYFYAPWSVLGEQEIEDLYATLQKSHQELIAYRKSR
jgi:hypothetical protein